MAHIKKIPRKKGTAYRVFYSVKGKPGDKYFPPGTPLQVVKAFVSEIENRKIQNKVNYNPLGMQFIGNKIITLAELQYKYIKARQYEIQISAHKLAFKSLLQYFPPDIPIDQIDHIKVNEYKNHRLKYKLKQYNNPTWEQEQTARRGVNNEYSNCRTIFTWAYKNDLIQRNPFDKTSKYSAGEFMISIPTRDQERRFYRELHSWQARLAFWFMRLAGLRRSEVRQLKFRHVNIDRGIIIIEKQKNRKAQVILMHKSLAILFTKFQKKFNIYGDPENLIFNFNKDYLTTAYGRAAKRAGLNIKSPVHIWRHVFITNTLGKTKNKVLTMNQARHSDYRTTQRYEHLLPEDFREEFDNVNFGSNEKIAQKSHK